ncbi:MAG: galactokinase [Bacteroidota bacterium]
MLSLTQLLSQSFQSKFNRDPFIFLAPGRINLIGEHTDYNMGFVMPAAVDKYMVFAIAPNENDRCNIYSHDFHEGATFSLLDLNPGEMWVNYLMGVLEGFIRKGLPVKGVDCIFGGDIPTGAGLSSSAALCCGFAFALNTIFNFHLSRLDLAMIAQYAEHEFAGVNCGLMDQYASLFGKKDSAILFDCKSLTHEYLPFHFNDIEVLLIDTKVKHSLASSAYNERRASCEEGVRVLQQSNPNIQSLRDADLKSLEQVKSLLKKDTFVKCRFVIQEIDRAHRGAQYLVANDLKSFGRIMYETHWALSKEYKVSCPESDLLVTVASESADVVIGARQMGGGFGGCIINLVKKEGVEDFSTKIKKKYMAAYKKEPDFYSIHLSDGVHQIATI